MYSNLLKIVVLTILVIHGLYASSLDGLNIDTSNEVLKGFGDFQANPNKFFDNYTSNPKEVALNKNTIKEESLRLSYNNEMSQDLRTNFNKRAEYRISAQELIRSDKVLSESEKIAQGIANQYTDCKTVKKCAEKLNNEIQYCDAKLTKKQYQCERERNVEVSIPNQVTTKIRFSITVGSKFGGTFKYSLKQQKLTYIDSKDLTSVSARQDKSINNSGCNNYNIRIADVDFLPNTFTYLVTKHIRIENPQDCTNPILIINLDQGEYKKYRHKARGIYADILINSQDNPVISDDLIGDCLELNKRVDSGICKIGKEVCVSGRDTKTINGVQVTRDCWRYKTNYSCGESTDTDNCSDLMNRGCVQISSECRDNIDGICTSFTRGYKCPIQSCQDDTNIICGDSSIHCLDGSCVSKAQNDSSDFNESISKLAVIDAAIKDKPQNFSEDTKFIFSGKVLSCRKTGYGFSDCCKDGGWGVDLGLAHCNSEEKLLGESKENKLVIYVGKNNHKTSEFEPDRVDKRYCVFSSKIARIIQEQGRFGQLGISFGSGKYPDCNGISAKMLSQIDMDKINLAEITDEIAGAHKDYDSSAVGNKLTNRIKDYYTKEVALNE